MKPSYSKKNFATLPALYYIKVPLYSQKDSVQEGSLLFWLVGGLADFHFHISWKLQAWLVCTDLTNTLSSKAF